MGDFACTYGRSKVALCPPAVSYQPFYFFSRYPMEVTSLWNLKNLLTPVSWFVYFLTIVSVILCLKLCCYVGRKLEPLDTAKQLVEKNVTLYDEPGGEIWKQFLLESSVPEYKILGENYIIADDWDHYHNMAEHFVI